VTEEYLLNDIHMKLNDIDFATQLAIEIRMNAAQNTRSHSSQHRSSQESIN
jgi:hypothetical protein